MTYTQYSLPLGGSDPDHDGRIVRCDARPGRGMTSNASSWQAPAYHRKEVAQDARATAAAAVRWYRDAWPNLYRGPR